MKIYQFDSFVNSLNIRRRDVTSENAVAGSKELIKTSVLLFYIISRIAFISRRDPRIYLIRNELMFLFSLEVYENGPIKPGDRVIIKGKYTG